MAISTVCIMFRVALALGLLMTVASPAYADPARPGELRHVEPTMCWMATVQGDPFGTKCSRKRTRSGRLDWMRQPGSRSGGRVLALRMPMPEIVRAPCPIPPATSCTWPGGPIYLSADAAHGELEHELGHHVDYNLMTDSDRAEFVRILGLSGEWRQPPNSPHEQFAEAFSHCAHSATKPAEAEWAYGYLPTRRQYARVCALIRGVVER